MGEAYGCAHVFAVRPTDGGQLTLQYCEDADALVVDAWRAAGPLVHLGYGVKPKRGRR
jgi:hypothetical protein